MQSKDTFSTSPRPYITAGLFVICLFFGGFGLWSFLGKMEGAIIAPGVIKVEKNRQDVQHLEGGIIQNIWVRDGNRVEKDQKLLTIRSAAVSSTVDMLMGQMHAATAMRARLIAERDLAEAVAWPPALLDKQQDANVQGILHAEQQVFESQRNSLKGQSKLLEAQVLQIQEQIKGLREQTLSEESIIRTLQEELVAKRELLEERFIEKPQVLALERELAAHEGRRSALQGEIAQFQERITETRVRLNELRTQYIERAVNQLSDVQTKLFDLEERIRPVVDAKERLDVVAPVSGTVVDLKVFSEGGVVRPGEVLMQIVPVEEPLIVHCNVRPIDIAKVHEGQVARIELNAFNRREVMPVDGKVVYVSADSIVERTPYGDQRVYLIHVEIGRGQVEEQEISLAPGMPVTVFLNTGERSFFDYIMDPLLENFRRALRE